MEAQSKRRFDALNPFRISWKRLFQRLWATKVGKHHILLVLAILFYSFFLIYVFGIRATVVVVTADLHTERVSFTVTMPRHGAFRISGMAGGPTGGPPINPSMTGLFTPALRSEVTYGRVGIGPVEIEVSPPPSEARQALAGHFEPDGSGPRIEFRGVTRFEANTVKDSGKAANNLNQAAPRFPIWGNATIGEAMHAAEDAGPAAPSLLIDGSLKISARSLLRGSLYPLTSLAIPVGAQIRVPRDQHGDVLWWGLAYVDPGRTDLIVELSTEAPVIELSRPGSGKTDRFSASGMAQLIDDPDILFLHIATAVLIVLIGLSDKLSSWLHDVTGKSEWS
jgi:hypothetical protein